MRRIQPIALVTVPILLCLLVTCVTATMSFTYRHYSGKVLKVNRAGRVIARPAEPKPTVDTGVAKAVVEETRHSFGVLDPGTDANWTFVIRNEGDGPLRLRKGPTTCKCTLSHLARKEITPGEEGYIQLEWTTEDDERFHQQAAIYTNDPDNEQLVFTVEGKVRYGVAVNPTGVNFGEVSPGSEEVRHLMLFSQRWKTLEILKADCSVEGVTWEIEPAPEKMLDDYDVMTAYLLKVKLPRTLRRGQYDGRLRIELKTDGEGVEKLDVPIRGQVLGRLAIYGKEVNPQGSVELGVLRSGEGCQARLIFKLRDEDHNLTLSEFHANPNFITAKLTPAGSSAGGHGLFYVDLEVPRDARVCTYLSPPYGKLHFKFDHPRLKELDLNVRLAILKN